MEKTKDYRNTFFKASVLKAAIEQLSKFEKSAKDAFLYMVVHKKAGMWGFDDFEEFLSEYKDDATYINYHKTQKDYGLELTFHPPHSVIHVKAPTHREIETVFNIFEDNLSDSKLPEQEETVEPLVIFIGHGGSKLWRDLKDHLQDKHGYEVVAYEIGSRAGHTIRDILEEMMEKSSIAFLVLTGEDETADKKLLARQNVIHETGLFQGRLGFSRGIVLLEEGTEEFSNLAGIQQIRFAKGNIKETFGEVLAVLRREFEMATRAARKPTNREI